MFVTLDEIDRKKLDVSVIAKKIYDGDMSARQQKEYIEQLWNDETSMVRVFYSKLYFFKRREIVTRKQHFTIAEPTLGTLDRIASESINFAITDAEMQSVDSLSVGMQKVHKNVEKCAKIVAYAVMGSEYEAPQLTKDGRLVIRPDIERFHELTQLFIRKLKPSSLYRLAQLIQLICNLGDFTNSIRLLQSDRTTMPSRIED